MLQDEFHAPLQLLLETSGELVSSLDLDVVLGRVLTLSTRSVGAERGTLIGLDETLKPVNAAIVVNQQIIPYTVEQLQSIVERGLAGWVMQNRQSVLINDTSGDERWLRRPDDEISRSGSKSAICLPLLVAGDQLVGILTIVHPQTGFFKPEHLDLLRAIGDQAGVAIYNARLYHSLQEAHSRYRGLFDDSLDSIFVTDWQGKILEANRAACEASGDEADRLIQTSILDLQSPDWKLLGENFGQLKTGCAVRYESTLKPSEKPFEIHVHAVQIGKESCLQWIFKDISERKALDALREELLAMIYHDLRSPLSNVISSLDMLQMMIPAESNTDIQAVFQIALRSAERLKRMISSLLDIYRLQSGQPIANLEDLNVSDLLQEALAVAKPNAAGHQQTIQIQQDADLPLIKADADMIKRVLINLLDNAVKFTPFQGDIILGAQKEDPMIRFWVQDSGAGIPDQASQKIFDKFIRLQTEGVPRGIGLGLSFCKLAVEAHGGHIWVESREGKGSRFSFTLPIKAI